MSRVSNAREKEPAQGESAPVPQRRKSPRNTGPSQKTRDKIREERAKYCCEMCHRYIGETGGEFHHRHGRLMGGTRRKWINWLSNLVLLCPPCHRSVTDTQGNRAEYERLGFLLREGQMPWDVPILWFGQQKVWLLNKWDPESGEDGYWQPNPDDLPAPKASVESREDAA